MNYYELNRDRIDFLDEPKYEKITEAYRSIKKLISKAELAKSFLQQNLYGTDPKYRHATHETRLNQACEEAGIQTNTTESKIGDALKELSQEERIKKIIIMIREEYGLTEKSEEHEV